MSNVYKIRSLGGTLVITLPQRIVREWSLVAGDEATLKTAKHNGNDAIVIEPLRQFGRRQESQSRKKENRNGRK
jgi:antitoxin component of MazEF toxin-antitoxin module